VNKPAGSQPILQAGHLSKYYGQFVAVQDVSFNVSKGEIVAVLGPNGAGKTTMMRMVTGFLEPTEGTVTVAGINIEADRQAAAAVIGYLPENGPVVSRHNPH